MNDESLKILIEKYLSGTANSEEERLLTEWYNNSIPDEIFIPFHSEMEKKMVIERMRHKIKTYAREKRQPRPYKKMIKIRIAATILLATGVPLLIYQHLLHSPKTNSIREVSKLDVLPGHSGAILTLSNGKNIILDSAANGTLALQGKSSIIKQDGKVIYQNHSRIDSEATYNTLTIPKGRQFKITLPDGTNVWLNSSSSLVYPTAFNGKERLVKLSGEGYFEVVHNHKQPFKVEVQNMLVEDIGTSFNINAYNDEPAIKTTVLRGSVSVALNNTYKVLKPGNQAIVRNAGMSFLSNVDTSDIIAWKDGFFAFNNAGISSIARQLSRWYNLNVIIDPKIKPRKFYGRVSHNLPLSEVLLILKQNQINFEIKPGNQLIIKT